MDINFQIEIDPTVAFVMRDAERTIEDVTAQIVRQIATDAPDEMRALMNVTGGKSARGEAPHRQSGFLARSLSGRVVSPAEAEIEMAGYAEYLDPIFGGKLDRPFIEEGVARTLAKSLSDL